MARAQLISPDSGDVVNKLHWGLRCTSVHGAMRRFTAKLHGYQVGALRSCARPAGRACAQRCAARLQSDQRADVASDSAGRLAIEEPADAHATHAREATAPVDEQVAHWRGCDSMTNCCPAFVLQDKVVIAHITRNKWLAWCL